MRYQISCPSDHVFGLPNASRNPCLDVSSKCNLALRLNIQAWIPGQFLTGVGMTVM